MAILYHSGLLISLIFIIPTLGALQQGFTTNIIHRDSPMSPLYNPSLDKWERARNSIHRSFSRINRFSVSVSDSRDVGSQVRSTSSEYIMELSYGTPPVSQLGIVDTGSDLTWIQCQPCTNCYKQKIPIFNPRKSSTYKVEPCESEACQALDPSQGSCRKNSCVYTYSYGDKSHTTGNIATETFTFNSQNRDNSTSFPRLAFGCGQDNVGSFAEDGSGLIGLGGGPLSLVSQLGSSIGGKFSYCLTPLATGKNVTSTINFGTNGVVSGHGVVSTPLVKKSPVTYYYLTLESISVEKTRIPFYTTSKRSPSLGDDGDYGGSGGEEGNIIIDSGTTLTFLPDDMFEELTTALTRVIGGMKVDDPTGTLQLCYQVDEELRIPNVTAHFSGADVELTQKNTFVNVAEDVVCFAVTGAGEVGGLAIFGNVAQGNYLVGYDLEEKTVSFKPTDCANQGQ